MILPCYLKICVLSSWHQPRDALEKGLLPKLRTQNEYMIFSKCKTACEITIRALFSFNSTLTRIFCRHMYFFRVAQTRFISLRFPCAFKDRSN